VMIPRRCRQRGPPSRPPSRPPSIPPSMYRPPPVTAPRVTSLRPVSLTRPTLRPRLLHLPLHLHQRRRQLYPEGLSGPEGLSRQEGRLPRQEGPLPRQEGLPHSGQPDPRVSHASSSSRRQRAHRIPPEQPLAALVPELDRPCAMARSPCRPR